MEGKDMSEQIKAVEKFAEQYEQIRTEIAKEMIGQADVVEHLLLAVIAGGNVLLEGVPGLGKTHLVRVLPCRSPAFSSHRI